MSKQSEAKERQGYVPKMEPQACMNCAYFLSVRIPEQAIEKNLRCGKGGFAVKKMGTCDEWAGNG